MKEISSTVVTTDSPLIAEKSLSLGAEVPFLRENRLAQDDTATHPVILDVLERWTGATPDLVVILQPTSPLRDASDIERAIELFLDFGAADSLVSCVEVPKRFRVENQMIASREDPNLTRIEFPQRKVEKAFGRNGPAIVIVRPETLISGSLYGATTLLFEMPEEKSIDIDTEFDFALADLLMARRLAKSSRFALR